MKFMNMKRFGAAVMAGVMTMALAAPAFATSTVIDGSYNPVTLAVTVPKTAKAIINPYGLPIDLDETTAISGQKITTGAPLLIENRSKVALVVGGTVTGEVKDGSDLSLVTAAPSTTDKEVQARVDLFEAIGVTEENFSETETLNALYAKTITTGTAKATVNVTTGGLPIPAVEGTNLVLREGDAEGQLQNGGAGFFCLAGAVTQKPTDEWTKEDGFTTTVAFTFTPAANGYPAITGGTASWKGGTAPANGATGTVEISAKPTGVKTISNMKVVSDDPTKIEVTDAAKGTVKVLATGTVTLTVTFDGDDGLPYKATLSVTINS